MDLARALRLIPLPSSKHPNASTALFPDEKVIAFAGAGGKTTAIFQLARALNAAAGQPVIVSATSHLGAWQLQLADHHLIASAGTDLDELPASGITLVTGDLNGDRTRPVSPELISHLGGICRERGMHLLIEADGSRSHPLKAPAGHEPPIPKFVDLVLLVAGMIGLNQLLTDQVVHRPRLFAALSGLAMGDPITQESLVRILLHPDGGLKNIPAHARRAVLLNQADTPLLQSTGGRMASALLQSFDSALVGSLHNASFQTFEYTAGIILAAGGSIRFGKPKQLLDWRGQPFIHAVARTALDAGLRPVIVVTGAHAEQVERAVEDLPVNIVRNAGWQEGQASSIRAGLRFLGSAPSGLRTAGSAIFLLVDQPQVTVSILMALAAAHTLDLAPVIAPLVLDQRANPVLFDRITFNDLLQLHGDMGGRGIFGRYHVEYLPWHDDRLLLDVDTPEQYARLKENETL